MSKKKEEVTLTVWEKEDGTKIKLNDLPATVAKAESLGWKKSK